MQIKKVESDEEVSIYRISSLKKLGYKEFKDYTEIEKAARGCWKRRMAFDLSYQRNKLEWLKK